MQTFIVIHVILVVVACWCLQWRSQAKKIQQDMQKVQKACAQGNYEEALILADLLKKSRPRTCWFLTGKMHYQLGQLEQAEECLRTGLAMETRGQAKCLAREALGKVLLEQERYQEAAECFEAAVADYPQSGAGHRGVAEVWLRQGVQSEEALNRARQAVEIDRAARGLSRETHKTNLAESTATLAWALAVQLHDAAEVDRHVARATMLCGSENKPISAQVNYHAGMAYAALASTAQSAHYFGIAADTDPGGIFGRRAQAARMPLAG